MQLYLIGGQVILLILGMRCESNKNDLSLPFSFRDGSFKFYTMMLRLGKG